MTSVPFEVGTLGPPTFLPITISCPVVFSWFSSMTWDLFPFKGDFNFGKTHKSQGTKSGLCGSWVPWVIWCFTKKLCTRQDVWMGMLSWWSCQSPVAHNCGLLNHPNSFHGGMFKLNAKFDADSLLYLFSHFECDSHTVHMLTQSVYHPYWPVQWSHHCSHMSIPVHSPWLQGYLNVAQTILIILTMTGLFFGQTLYKHCAG